MSSRRRKPRVLIDADIDFGGRPLSQIVEEAGCEPVLSIEELPSSGAQDGDLTPLSLIILSLDSDPTRLLMRVAEWRRAESLVAVPIIGIRSQSLVELDSHRLRALGLTGLLDAGAPSEQVRLCVSQLAYQGSEGRRFRRAPCCIPVEVAIGKEAATGYATSLSVGGMGLACSRRIEPNTTIGLRLALEEGEEPVSISARTVRLREARRRDAEYEIGLVFQHLPRGLREEITATVNRLLAAWDTVIASGLIGDPGTDPVGADCPGAAEESVR